MQTFSFEGVARPGKIASSYQSGCKVGDKLVAELLGASDRKITKRRIILPVEKTKLDVPQHQSIYDITDEDFEKILQISRLSDDPDYLVPPDQFTLGFISKLGLEGLIDREPVTKRDFLDGLKKSSVIGSLQVNPVAEFVTLSCLTKAERAAFDRRIDIGGFPNPEALPLYGVGIRFVRSSGQA